MWRGLSRRQSIEMSLNFPAILNMARMGTRLVARGYVTPRKITNAIRCLAHPYLGNVLSSGCPPVLAIDPAATCNLRCVACPAGNAPAAPFKNMDFSAYTQVIDQVAPDALAVFLYVVGEPFMNKDLALFIEYAHRRRLYSMVSTNGHFIHTPEQAERIVKSGLDELIISISGLSQAVYEKYHRNGRIAVVLKTLDELVAARARLKSKTPRINIRYLKFWYNLEECSQAKAHVMRAGADAFVARTARGDIAADILGPQLAAAVEEYQKDFLVPSLPASQPVSQPRYRRCLWPWLIGVVNWDGALAPCTQYPWTNDVNAPNYLGNAFGAGGFRGAWRGNRIAAFRKRLLNKNQLPEFCQNCIRSVGFGDNT